MEEVRDVKNHFDCTISQENIRTFATVMSYLGKVGKELLVEVDDKDVGEDGSERESDSHLHILTLRALNDSKSSFTCVEFDTFFFEGITRGNGNNGVDDGAFSCKVAIKPICALLRQFKNVTSLKISAIQTGSTEHNLVFRLFHSNGVHRIHRLQYRDCEIVHAQYEEEGASILKSEPSVFVQLLEHVRQSPEVALTCSLDSFKVSSFHKSEAGDGKRQQMNTELDVNISSFDEYIFMGGADDHNHDVLSVTEGVAAASPSPQNSTRIVFCAREVRAFVSLCEACEIDGFTLFFTHSGQPMKFFCKLDSCFELSFVLATLDKT